MKIHKINFKYLESLFIEFVTKEFGGNIPENLDTVIDKWFELVENHIEGNMCYPKLFGIVDELNLKVPEFQEWQFHSDADDFIARCSDFIWENTEPSNLFTRLFEVFSNSIL